jgi:integrase
MGTIITRKRDSGSIAYTAQIRLKRDKKIIHQEAKTFDRKPAAVAWLKKRESELAEPGALEKLKAPDPLLTKVIDQYLAESRRDYGKTKKQVLRTIQVSSLGGLKCSEIGSAQIMEFAQSLNVLPQTVGNYLAHLASVFAIARPAWGYPLDKTAIDDARTVGQRMGVTSRSRRRERRPTLDELDKLMEHYAVMQRKRTDAIPMQDIILFALFSTRRLDEIARIVWEDLDAERAEVIVRSMKHPGEKIGNDVRVNLPPEAMAIIRRQPTKAGRIFPFNGDSISTSFTRACQILAIEDLHFHDMRHEGISRLFEMGATIPQAATVSGHRTWTSLKRYSHIRQAGDKYAGWKWLPVTAGPPHPASPASPPG